MGLLKKKNIILGNACNDDLYMIYVGSKTGNEGINGAAMASNTFIDSEVSDSLKSNVQKSDPFLEKLLLEACCELSDQNLVEGMQDMGAGGMLCATMEVVKRGREKSGKNIGCNIYLNNVPKKYPMDNCNVLISESQERMLIVAQKSHIPRISGIFQKWDLEFAIVGKTDLTGEYTVLHEKEILYTERMDSFNDVHDHSNFPSQYSIRKKWKKEPVKLKDMELWRQYDCTVGNRTIKGPDQPHSHSIIDLHEVNKHLILTWGESVGECMEEMKKFDGVKPLCIVNCLNYGDPKDSLCDLSNDIKEMSKTCKENNIPVVGGNVSLYNTTGNSSIWSTPMIVLAGIV